MKISFIKPIIGLTIIVILIYFIDINKTIDLLININLIWFVLSIFIIFVACLVVSRRYQKILKYRKLKTKFYFQLKILYEGIAFTNLLPIGHIGIDLWRIKAIKNISDFSYLKILNTLLSDRISGFLGLVFISTSISIIIYLFFPNITFLMPNLNIFTISIFDFYIILCTIISLSSIISFFAFKVLGTTKISNVKFFKFIKYFKDALNIKLIINSFILSLINNILVMTAFWCCTHAVGIELPYLLILGMGIAIIIPSVLPFAIAGFGPREAGVIIIFSLFDIGMEEAFLCSLLFGLIYIIHGLLGAIFFMIPDKN